MLFRKPDLTGEATLSGPETYASAAIGRALRITLVGEGTYPYEPGGVSLWCHQLIEGMPEHSFTAVCLTVDGTEAHYWPHLDNLVETVNIPLWTARRHISRRLRRAPKGFADLHDPFLRSLVPAAGTTSVTPDNADVLVSALRGMFEYAQARDLAAALVSNDSIDRMLQVWNDGLASHAGRTPLVLQDALTATDRIEHMLRPLSHPPVKGDVSHLSMNGLSAVIGLTGKWTYGTPMLMSEHGVYLRERYLGLGADSVSHPVKEVLQRFHRTLATAAYRNCDLLTPHSTHNRRWQLYNGADPARMKTMYNGIDPADFPKADGEPERPTIVFVGRIDPLKDLHTLIRAFAIVRQRLPNAQLRMFGPVTAGNQTYAATCVELVNELGLSDCASFEGRIPNQLHAYQAGHVVALTSVSEGFPYTVVESMSTGRAQVCTNVGGVSEAVGDAGFVVPPRDHEAVAEACVRLLEDDELRTTMGARARSRVLERFTLQQWTEAYRDIYRVLADDSRRELSHPVPPLLDRATQAVVPR
jgi:polysaccharide biosynthesis protein PelF